jgi:predicted N-acetyltransferase YhbS
MDIRIMPEHAITPTQDRAIRELLCACFPADAASFNRSRGWHASMPLYSILLDNNGILCAHVGVVDRTIRAGNEPVRVAGIQNVGVHPACRGQGLADRIMIAAMNEARTRGFDCGLLYCVPRLEKVYQRTGWITLPGAAITCRDHLTGQTVQIPSKNIAMYHPLKLAAFPAGPIDLQGTDW